MKSNTLQPSVKNGVELEEEKPMLLKACYATLVEAVLKMVATAVIRCATSTFVKNALSVLKATN